MSLSTLRIGKRLPLAILLGASLGGMPLASGPVHAAQAPTATSYTVTDLGTFGGTFATGRGLNMQGDVAGYWFDKNLVSHAFLFVMGSGENGLTSLGTLGGDNSQAYKPNNSGEVVGTADNALNDPRAVIFFEGGITNLGTLGGDDSYGYGINNNGQAVGGSSTKSDLYHAFLYDPGFNRMFDLGTLPGGGSSEAHSINDSQNTVGDSNTGGGAIHAALWDLQFVTDLGTLGGANSDAEAINNNNNVVGFSETTTPDPSNSGTTNEFHATGWQRATRTHVAIQDLGTYTGDFDSAAYGINNNNVAVGGSGGYVKGGNTPEPFRAVIFNRGRVEDLNNLVPSGSLYLVNAYDINDRGQITGYALDNQDRYHAFLLTPDTHSRFHRRAVALSRAQAAARVERAMAKLSPAQRQQLSFGTFRVTKPDHK